MAVAWVQHGQHWARRRGHVSRLLPPGSEGHHGGMAQRKVATHTCRAGLAHLLRAAEGLRLRCRVNFGGVRLGCQLGRYVPERLPSTKVRPLWPVPESTRLAQRGAPTTSTTGP